MTSEEKTRKMANYEAEINKVSDLFGQANEKLIRGLITLINDFVFAVNEAVVTPIMMESEELQNTKAEDE